MPIHHRKGKKKSGRKNGKRTRKGNHEVIRVNHQVQSLRAFLPESYAVRLPYTATFSLINSVGTSASKALRTNAPYDVDPNLGSTATQGFNQFAANYGYYRCLKYKYKIEVFNSNIIPVNAVVISSIVNLTGSVTIGTYSLDQIQNNPSAQNALMGHAYNESAKHVFHKTMKPENVEGTPMTITDDHYQALINAVPANLTWICFSATTSAGGTNYLINNVTFKVCIWMDILFYGRGDLSS